VKQERLRVGVVGVGHLGEYHVQKYMALPNVELVGVVDTDPHRLNEISERYGVASYGTHADLLKHVEALSLAVTYMVEPADTLIQLALKGNLVLQVGLVERFNPAVVRMESLLTEPIFVESHRMNQFTPRGTDVDVVLDLMIHDLDIFLHIVQSEVKEVHATGMSVVTDKTDIANARIIFQNGTVANLTASRVSNKTLRKIRVFQRDAYLSVNCFKREISVIRLDTQMKDPEGFPQLTTQKTGFPNSDPLADQISAFVTSVINGTDPVVTGRDGRRALDVALGIIHQIETGSRKFQDFDSVRELEQRRS